MKEINTVYQTNNYNQFNILVGNRPVSKLHVRRLKKSFEKRYLMSPIIVNEKFDIIDGQHRFCAAKELGYPVNYIVVEGYGLEEVKSLNTNNSNWKKRDYLDAYVDLGYESYIKFKKFMNTYEDFGIGSCEVLLSNTVNAGQNNRRDKSLKSQTNKEGTYALRTFQEGELEIKDYDLACENAEKIMMIKPYYIGYSRTVFVRVMIGLFNHENYEHRKLLDRLKSNPTAMQHCTNITQYKLMIEEIYNFRSRNKVSLRF